MTTDPFDGLTADPLHSGIAPDEDCVAEGRETVEGPAPYAGARSMTSNPGTESVSEGIRPRPDSLSASARTGGKEAEFRIMNSPACSSEMSRSRQVSASSDSGMRRSSHSFSRRMRGRAAPDEEPLTRWESSRTAHVKSSNMQPASGARVLARGSMVPIRLGPGRDSEDLALCSAP
jgi:hypothetical protein